MLDMQNLAGVLADLEAAVEYKTYNHMAFFEPYEKQKEFFAYGKSKRERLFMAGNQLGKTEAGAFETACHLTGLYPKDWPGRKFDHPVRGWAAGESSLLVRDVSQKKMCGEPGVDTALGTGMVPRDSFIDKPSLSRGVTDAYDTIQVKHRTNGVEDGISILRFKSYEQGRTKFQGETIDFIWLDEEPDMDIYSECLTRTNATKGIVYMTFTPLKGMSLVVMRYLNEKSDDRQVITMAIEDVGHYTKAEREKIIADYPEYEREARAHGTPMLGSGRIFPLTEELIKEPPLEYIPQHWVKLWGLDFGIGHPFAAVLILWDRDNDVVHVHHCIKVAGALPINHAAAIKPIGAGVPVAWPHDGNVRDKGSGDQLASLYKAQGLVMLAQHATWPEGGYSTEAGIAEMSERMLSGRLKVASQLSEWFNEFRQYHRKDGLIVKLNDDLMSATRIALMMKRFARSVGLGGRKPGSHGIQLMAKDIDFDLG